MIQNSVKGISGIDTREIAGMIRDQTITHGYISRNVKRQRIERKSVHWVSKTSSRFGGTVSVNTKK